MDLRKLLQDVKDGSTNIDDALSSLKNLPYEDIGYANIDHHRQIRNGYPEVIYCEGKNDEHILGIIGKMIEKKSNILGTRCRREIFEKIKNIYPNCEYEEISKILKIRNNEIHNNGKGKIVVVSGGTSDIPVADEAYHTAKFLGNNVERVYDVGVAGISGKLKTVFQLIGLTLAILGVALNPTYSTFGLFVTKSTSMGAVELLINVGMTVSIACAVLATLWSLVDYIVRFKKDINVEE